MVSLVPELQPEDDLWDAEVWALEHQLLAALAQLVVGFLVAGALLDDSVADDDVGEWPLFLYQ